MRDLAGIEAALGTFITRTEDVQTQGSRGLTGPPEQTVSSDVRARLRAATTDAAPKT